ncbi:hypothetical protein [Thermoanaerobacter sp. YS13]|uniref:hypothetical protein n=1 Tax=Thermoanaerobacter sp. YS13 TaxID=1511746 RepID=UPI000A43673D|nr:hypothetical protein [Thermoanaerobacter sp. YS13]
MDKTFQVELTEDEIVELIEVLEYVIAEAERLKTSANLLTLVDIIEKIDKAREEV